MVNKPCIKCGEPSPGTYCPGCRPADTRTDRNRATNTTRWKAFSKRLRRASPFCETCGSVEDLSVDHLLPVSDYPELEYAEENCRILCKPCNGKRGNKFTTADAHTVLTRLQHSYQRRPTKNGRQRVDIAQKAVLTRGEGPSGPLSSPVGKAQGAMKTTMVFNKGVSVEVG